MMQTFFIAKGPCKIAWSNLGSESDFLADGKPNGSGSILRPVCLLVLLLAGLANAASSASIISFNLLTGTQNYMFPQDLAGAPGVRTTNWNQITSSTLALGAGSIMDHSGAILPNITVTLTPNASFSDRGAGVTNDNKMINTVIDKYDGSPGVLVVSNIPYAAYNVYLYARPDYPLPGNGLSATRGGYFTLTNSAGVVQRRYISTQDKVTAQALPMTVNSTNGSGYILANTTNIAASGSFAQIDGGNYVEFTGLTGSDFTVLMSALGSGAADDAGNVITNGDSVCRLKWCGFQIEEVINGTATNLSLGAPFPNLLAGNPTPFALQVLANYDSGASADVTGNSSTSYTSENPGIFSVSAGGSIQPQAAGTADLVVQFQSLSLTQAVTVLAPVSLSPPTAASSNLFVGGLGDGVTMASLLATFNGQTNVDVSSFNGTTFSGGPAGVVNVTSNGTVTAVGAGSFFLVGNYGGLSATNASAGSVTALSGNVIQLASPDGGLVLNFSVNDFDGSISCPVYSVTRNGTTIVAPSRLGLTFGEAALRQNLIVMGSTTNSHDSTWQSVCSERSTVRDHYNELTVNLQETVSPNRQLQLTFRAYNEGVAFCYTVPQQSGLLGVTNLTEQTEFRFDSNYTAWSVTSAQGVYSQTTISGVSNGCERPLPIQLATNLYAAIGEARVVDYSRMKFNQLGETDSLVSVLGGPVTDSLPLTTPWRVIMAADSPGQLLENNDIFLNLNDPCQLADTSWIKPGKCIREVTLSTTGGLACVDFAVKHKLQYIEFDAGWYGPEGSTTDATSVATNRNLDLPRVIKYGLSNNVGVILYVNHIAMEAQLNILPALYHSWGVKGIKIGFVNVGPQYWTAWVPLAVRVCATNQIMVDVHDEYRMTGYNRTYPNFMTSEGILGDEGTPTTANDMVNLFSRMLGGPADHTYCYFDNRVSANWTHACQLAKPICFFSPWQFVYWYDKPTNSPSYTSGAADCITDEPELEFWDAMPTVWDDTRVIQSSIGDYAVVARRYGGDWFLGAMNGGQTRTLSVPLDFLTPGKLYLARRYSNDSALTNRNQVRIDTSLATATNVLQLAITASNGETWHFTPVATAFTSFTREPTGIVSLTATGVVNAPFSLWRGTNLNQPIAAWTLLSAGVWTNGPMLFNDPAAAGLGQGFYRLSTP